MHVSYAYDSLYSLVSTRSHHMYTVIVFDATSVSAYLVFDNFWLYFVFVGIFRISFGCEFCDLWLAYLFDSGLAHLWHVVQ